jgi:putative transposase
VQTKGASIRQACADFSVSETCYQYQPKRSSESAVIADRLLRLTHNQRNWGFGLCFIRLRNVKDFG